MNKYIYSIILTGLTVLNLSAAAQTVKVSEVDNYPTEIGENAIIRTSPSSGGSLIYYEAPDKSSYFLYRHDNGTTCQFPWPNYSSLNNHQFKIHDMVLGKEEGYFCGSYISNPATNPVETGLVGRIDLSQVENNPCSTAYISFKLCTIPGTRVFNQMDRYFDDINNVSQICMVGESSSATTLSCAAFAIWDPTVSKWYYRMVESQDPDERMTDIAFSGLGTKVVAVSRYANEPYKFGLRGELTINLFDYSTLPPLTNFTHRNTVNTYGLYLMSSSNPNPTWHENDIVARIACPPNSEEFTVAYECVDNTKTCETPRQVALFRIDVSTFPWNYNMNVTGKQIVRGYFEEGSTFSDMIYIPDNKTYALLHQSKNSSKGNASAVQFPSWLAYGQINTLISDAILHSSLDKNGVLLDIIGNSIDDNSICLFRQQLNFLETSCYQTMPISISEELIEDNWSTYQGVRNINYYYSDKPGTGGGSPISNPTTWTIQCKTFHIQ